MGKQHKAAKATKKGAATAAAAAAAAPSGAAAPEKQERHKGKGKARRSKKDVHHYGGDDLERELAAVGLRIKQIEADGNCFFRSVMDQLEGDGGDHLQLRQRVMEYVEEREEEYKFFMEDDEPFDKYLRRMKKEGAWAGHLELQATSLLLERNICIYQAGQPVWRINNHDKAPEEETLHLSYHDGMHYNSVRNADDYGSGPPEPVHMRSTGAQPSAAGAAAGSEPAFGAAEVDQVVAGTGCFDRERIKRMLEQCCGSVEQAIEQLIEQLGQEEPEPEEAGGGDGSTAADSVQRQEAQGAVQQQTAGLGQRQAGSGLGAVEMERPQQAAAVAATEQQQLADDSIRLELRPCAEDPGRIQALLAVAAAGSQQAAEQQAEQQAAGEPDSGDKRSGKRGSKGVKVKHKPEHPGRNQRCPCGSGKKVKNCCGALRGKRGAAAVGRITEANEGDSGAVGAAVQLQVLHI